jgi:hypothetical protein
MHLLVRPNGLSLPRSVRIKLHEGRSDLQSRIKEGVSLTCEIKRRLIRKELTVIALLLRREETGVLVMELSENFLPQDLELAVFAVHDIARSPQNTLCYLLY